MSTITGGANDLIRWRIEINEYLRSESVYGSRSPVMFRECAPDADLTLYGINKEECEAVVALVNEMRSGPRMAVPVMKTVKSSNRFAELDFE